MTKPAQSLVSPILIGGCLILIVGFGIRAAFGIFQIPIAEEFGWPRSEFSMAIAIQNLAWGIGQPVFGALADRLGDRRAILLGALMYAAGLTMSAFAATPGAIQAYEVLVGFGIAGTGFGVILAMVARGVSDDNRSMAMAIAAAAGSGGQIIGPLAAEALLTVMPWQTVFLIFAAAVLATIALLPMMRAPERASKAELEQTIGQVLRYTFRDPSYTMIFLGFFACGYQVAFITAHFPAFVTEVCGPIVPGSLLHDIGITTTSALGALSIALIGLANIFGTLAAGWAGKRLPKKHLLAGIYLGRTLISAAFILTPMTPETVVLFSVSMGALWLATIPLTSGLIAHIYGLRNMGMLYGLVFFSHQLGSFLGVWLGGRLYDVYGDYTLVWWVGVGVGAFSAIVHLPIRERPLAQAHAA